MGFVPPDRSADSRSVSTKVIETVASRNDVDPIDLEPPLYETIDLDALDALVTPSGTESTRSGCHIWFTYCGYTVTVDRDGAVTVNESESAE